MRKYGITGFRGRLGSYLLSHYDNFVALDCDVTRPDNVENCIGNSGVDVIVHLAAKSDVDFCENPENRQLVTNVNLRGTFNVCLAAEKVRADVLLLSSDHVFSGKWGRYKEKDKPSPVNFYGMSKLAAENLQSAFDNLKVIRTSYLFDYSRLQQDFYSIINNYRNDKTYPTFIKRSFMYLPHFAFSLNHYLSSFGEMPKILHISGYHCVSWYEFMKYWCEANRVDPKFVIPRKESLDNEFAPRPRKVGLNVSLSRKLGFPQLSYIQGILQMAKDNQ